MTLARPWHWLGAVALTALQSPLLAGPLAVESQPVDARAWMARVQQAAMTLNYQGTLVFNAAGVVSSSRVTHYCEGKHRYERIDGRWFFRRRLPLYWYATDLNKPPIGDKKMRWPGREPYDGGWGDFWPTWKAFWADPPDLDGDVAEPAPIDQFLTTMRRGAAETLSVKVR